MAGRRDKKRRAMDGLLMGVRREIEVIGGKNGELMESLIGKVRLKGEI